MDKAKHEDILRRCGLPRAGRYRVRVTARTPDGRRVVRSRRYRACVAKLRSKGPSAAMPGYIFAAGLDPNGIPYYCARLVQGIRSRLNKPA